MPSFTWQFLPPSASSILQQHEVKRLINFNSFPSIQISQQLGIPQQLNKSRIALLSWGALENNSQLSTSSKSTIGFGLGSRIPTMLPVGTALVAYTYLCVYKKSLSPELIRNFREVDKKWQSGKCKLIQELSSGLTQEFDKRKTLFTQEFEEKYRQFIENFERSERKLIQDEAKCNHQLTEVNHMAKTTQQNAEESSRQILESLEENEWTDITSSAASDRESCNQRTQQQRELNDTANSLAWATEMIPGLLFHLCPLMASRPVRQFQKQLDQLRQLVPDAARRLQDIQETQEKLKIKGLELEQRERELAIRESLLEGQVSAGPPSSLHLQPSDCGSPSDSLDQIPLPTIPLTTLPPTDPAKSTSSPVEFMPIQTNDRINLPDHLEKLMSLLSRFGNGEDVTRESNEYFATPQRKTPTESFNFSEELARLSAESVRKREEEEKAAKAQVPYRRLMSWLFGPH